MEQLCDAPARDFARVGVGGQNIIADAERFNRLRLGAVRQDGRTPDHGGNDERFAGIGKRELEKGTF